MEERNGAGRRSECLRKMCMGTLAPSPTHTDTLLLGWHIMAGLARSGVQCTACLSRSLAFSRPLSTTPLTFSGSNRWSKVKHKKFALDAVKSNTFSRLTSDLVTAVRSGGTDPENNVRLAIALKKAKALNYPKDRLEATISKASKSGDNTVQLSYDILGPIVKGGASVALIMYVESGRACGDSMADHPFSPTPQPHSDCEADSAGHNRAMLKEVLSRKPYGNDTRLSSVSHMFERKGIVRVTPASDKTIDEAFEVAIEHGAEEMDEAEPESASEVEAVGADGTVLEIRCSPSDINAISKALKDQGHNLHEAEQRMLIMGPPLRIRDPEVQKTEEDCVIDAETAGWIDEATLAKLDRLKENLEDDVGCQRIWCVMRSPQRRELGRRSLTYTQPAPMHRSNVHGWP